MPTQPDIEEDLNRKALKWQSGPRKLMVIFMPVFIVVASFFINQYNQTRKERFSRALENLNRDKHKGIRLSAIDDLSDFVANAHHDLFDLYMLTNDEEIKNRVFIILEPYYESINNHDMLVHLRARQSETIKEAKQGWLYVGNYDTSSSSWLRQADYTTTLSLEEINLTGSHPDALINEIITVTFPPGVTIRSNYPSPGLASVTGTFEKGTRVKITEVKNLPLKTGAKTHMVWCKVSGFTE
ncbi:hypothetical protein FNH22_29125 [Fulvivirga sp. M361]|uniref:hypothetical protein n=1 Tax=Fulvivirga sp. M361 TaxID=2594266 RepID=UPI00117B5E98|nr:hypothetical protein [Fulvivirga sp. M361]TRX48381.1 hypothetical protein FNH22_29125 [Fulvivirga sp. M361]